MKENWKSIKGYKGLYEVSDLGRVRSLNYGGNGKVKELKPVIRRDGYLRVVLCKNGKKRGFYVHRLVVIAFIGPIPAGMQVNHRNEDKTDNRLSNLEILTAKQNTNYGTRNERAAESLKGNTNGNKQLQLTNTTTCAKYTFSSSYEASTFFGYRKTTFATFIFYARKRKENFINIKSEKYYFSQNTE